MKYELKLFVLFAVFFSNAVALGESQKGKNDGKNFEDISNNTRIAGGTQARRAENKDFCFLSIRFIQTRKTCGCVLVAPQWVLTSARCLHDQQEGPATNITVTFPQLHGAERLFDSFVVPSGTNGADAMNMATLSEAYNPSVDNPFNIPTFEPPVFANIAPSNVAMIRLAQPLDSRVIDGRKLSIAKFSSATDFANLEATAMTNNLRFRTCGVGALDNDGTRPHGIRCTDVNPIQCPANPVLGTAPNYPEDGTAICLQWTDRPNNICIGDLGGPVWVYSTNLQGRETSSEVFCITVGSTNIQPATPCSGTHDIVCMFTPGNVGNWVQGIIANRVVSTTTTTSTTTTEATTTTTEATTTTIP